MTSVPPLYDVRLLKFPVEAFAKTAVSNAIWLLGEWHAQKPCNSTEFSPKLPHLFAPQCRPQALRKLDGFDSATRYKVFVVSFMWHPNAGETLFQKLVSTHSEMLREALDAEWTRTRARAGLAGSQPDDNGVAKELLLGFASARYNGQSSNKD